MHGKKGVKMLKLEEKGVGVHSRCKGVGKGRKERYGCSR